MKVDFIFDEGLKKEDAYLVKEPTFGVFDGFNGLVDSFINKEGKTGGSIASLIAKEVFSENGENLYSLTQKANEYIKEAMLSSNISVDDKARLWGTALAVVRIKDNSFEWIQIADCLILVIYKDNSFRLLVNHYNHDQEVLSIWKKFADQKQENIRELVKEDLKDKRRQINKSHGALTGEEEALAFLKSGEEQLDNISDIILLTDGFILPKEDPKEDDNWKLFVELFKKGGLEEIRAFVRDLENKDPKCWKYPRFKKHDDIAAIAISFT